MSGLWAGRSLSHLSDADLVERFGSGRGEPEFRALYRRHSPQMRAISLRMTGSDSAAEDVVQEAWLRAVRAFASFKGRSAFRSWLIGFVINVARETRRRSMFEALVPDALAENEDCSSDPLARIELERAVDGLPQGYRTVLLMHDVGGFTHAEIGEALGIGEGTSKSQLLRSKRVLRERLLRPQEEDDRDQIT
jgi:RNA polymerase sigma-70 factor (ECF subfamily)